MDGGMPNLFVSRAVWGAKKQSRRNTPPAATTRLATLALIESAFDGPEEAHHAPTGTTGRRILKVVPSSGELETRISPRWRVTI